MTISPPDVIVEKITVTDRDVRVKLQDGRTVLLPFTEVATLAAALPAQRANWRVIGRNQGVHWPDLDEDLSVAGILRSAALDERSTGASST